MKSKRILSIIILYLMMSMVGCDNKKEIPEALFTAEVNLSDLIPDPKVYFLNTEFEMVTLENSYTVYLDYVTEEEWETYISKCEEDGFWVNETYRSDYSWYVYSEDKTYQLLLDRYGNNNEYMTILVKEIEEEDENEK